MLQKKPVNKTQARAITKELLKGKVEEREQMKKRLSERLIEISIEQLPHSIREQIRSDIYGRYIFKRSSIVLKTSDDKHKFTYSLNYNDNRFYTKSDSPVVIVSLENIKEVEKLERKIAKSYDINSTLNEQIYSLLLRLRSAKKIVEQFPEVAGMLEEEGTSMELTNVEEYRNLLGLPELPKDE